MQTVTSNTLLSPSGCVVALGNFDGVHIGHAALIRRCVALARENSLHSCVYTFSEHPANFKDGMCCLITDNDEKSQLIEELGADILYFDDFDGVKELSCEDFCRDILVGKLCAEIVVCGENFRFGKNRAGDAGALSRIMKSFGKKAEIIGHVTDSTGGAVSSTAIRRLISDGDTVGAARLLGRPFSVFTEVIHGRHLGTEIGVPTINQLFPEGKTKPKNGVYACLCTIDGKKYVGVANIGTKPTVTDGEKDPPVLCETHIIAYSGDLYGVGIKVEFYDRLRDEKKFSGLEELVSAIDENIRCAKDIFANREDVVKE